MPGSWATCEGEIGFQAIQKSCLITLMTLKTFLMQVLILLLIKLILSGTI
jgi:hypothetical protein